MSRPVWFVELLKLGFPKRFSPFILTKIPFIERLVVRMFFNGDDVICLPRDMVIPVGEAAQAPESYALPSEVVHHFIDQANFHWIMNFCICRDAMHCKDYPVDYGCIFLGESAAGINPKLGRRVTKEEAHAYARRVREAGLVQTIGRTKLDSVWLGVGNKLMTICNCCPCCCLTRFLVDAGPNLKASLHRMPGIRVQTNDSCIGCGTCEGICIAKAIRVVDGQSVIDQELCRGCGRCIALCPQKAITVTVDDPRYVARAIDHLSPLVDLT